MGCVRASFGAACWQPTGLMECGGASLGLYVGNLQVLRGSLGLYIGNRCYGVCWGQFGAVCWQPTCLLGCVEASLGVYVGNLHVLWVCWGQFGAVCWQPIGLMGCVWASLGLYVGAGNLHVLWRVFEPVWCCMLATYRSYGVCWSQFAAVCWQPTGLMLCVWASLGLYAGNLQVLWGVWNQFGAVCWQPAGLMACVGDNLRLYVRNLKVLRGPNTGNLQVLWGVLEPVWGCMLATYKSYGACWSQFAAVCWQPTGLMGCVGSSLRLYVGNLHVLWGVLKPVCGCMLATYRSYGVCGANLAVYGRNLGNLHVFWAVLEPVWGCTLATYNSYGACWGLGL